MPDPKTNETTDYLIGAEIRQRLRAMTRTERMVIFAHAVANKSTAVRRAIETDPLREKLIPREYADRVVHEHAQQTEGAQWQRLQTLQFLSERLLLLANALEYRLKNYGIEPTLSTPPTSTSDLGQVNTQQAPPKSKADQSPAHVSSFQ